MSVELRLDRDPANRVWDRLLACLGLLDDATPVFGNGKAVPDAAMLVAVRFLKRKLRLRQVSRLSDNGHQTHVITSRWDLTDIEVAYRMFECWRQENFFK
jgi:hypothetical protein